MLQDAYNRKIDYLRISVTDRCNLRCVYCMPSDGVAHKPASDILSFEDIQKVAKIAVRLGVRKIRITGGEPLVRKDLTLLIKKLRGLNELQELVLTTNGVFLEQYADSLKAAGLDRINISLDSLNRERFYKITRGGNLDDVFKGIESAFKAGLAPVKINTVLMKNFNEDEILDFARLTENRPLHIRFIEHMPTYLDYENNGDTFFSASLAKDICSQLGELTLVVEGANRTARVFQIENFCGTVGFISPISKPFCSSCNKLRLTADGRLRSCLHSSTGVDLKIAIKNGAGDGDLSVLIKKAAGLKPKSHNLLEAPLKIESENFSMCQIGG